MIRIVELGGEPRKEYYKIACPYCDSLLVCDKDEMWCDDYMNKIFRIECPNPKCRKKIHGILESYKHRAMDMFLPASEEEFKNAHTDTSRSGLQMLMDAKKQEDISKEVLNDD